MVMSCFAYIADRTPAERRIFRITLLQLCMLIAGIVSSIALGPVVGVIGVEYVILVVVFISVINFAYVFFFLRDDDQEQVVVNDRSGVGQSDTDDECENTTGYTTATGCHRRMPRFPHTEPRSEDNVVDLSHSLNRDSPEPRSESAEPRVDRQMRTLCDDVRHLFSLFLSPRQSRVRLNILMAAFFISLLPTFDLPLLNLFEMNHPLCWTIGEVAQFTGISIAVSALGALVVTPVMKKCANDWHIAVTSSVAAFITEVYRFFVRDSLMMYLCKYVMLPLLLSLISDVNKDLGPPEAKAKAKD